MRKFINQARKGLYLLNAKIILKTYDQTLWELRKCMIQFEEKKLMALLKCFLANKSTLSREDQKQYVLSNVKQSKTYLDQVTTPVLKIFGG